MFHGPDRYAFTIVRPSQCKNESEPNAPSSRRTSWNQPQPPVFDPRNSAIPVPGVVLGNSAKSIVDLIEGRRIVDIPNVHALLLGPLWYFGWGLWKKGLMYAMVEIVVVGFAFCPIPIVYWGLAWRCLLCFSAYWDFYLYKVHGESFFSSAWFAGIRTGRFPEELLATSKRGVGVQDDGSRLSVQREKRDKRIVRILAVVIILIGFLCIHVARSVQGLP